MTNQDVKSYSIARDEILGRCDSCEVCGRSCAFLRKFGSPAEIAEKMHPENAESLSLSFSCSLCGLCSAVCPRGQDPARMFLFARAAAVSAGYAHLPGHQRWIDFEDRGRSKRYSLFAIPEGSDTVFFPGCSLPGKRPDAVKKLYAYLSNEIPKLGVVLSCCGRPSRDLGLFDRFRESFSELGQELSGQGVTKVITACPGCQEVFSGRGDFTVRSVYEIIAKKGWQSRSALTGTVTIHDPCVSRIFPGLHDSVREIVSTSGLGIREMENRREKTLCCGEGGCVSAVSPEFSRAVSATRRGQAGDTPVVTYCSGCITMLGGPSVALHVLDLVFSPERALSGKIPLAKPPMTYVNRLLLKRILRKTVR